MREALYVAERELAAWIQIRARGRATPALLDVEVQYEAHSDYVMFLARLEGHHGRESFGWRMRASECDSHPRYWARPFSRECRSIYSRLLENYLLELELQPLRQELSWLLQDDAAPSWAIQAAAQRVRDAERHVHRYHASTAAVVGVDWGGAVRYAGAAAPTFTMQDLVRAREMMTRASSAVQPGWQPYPGAQAAYFGGGDVGNEESQRKGLALLKSWLSPEQLASYEQHKHFDVTGSDSGKRYRIRHGRQMNIDELDADGGKVCGWCFLPEGALVAGDVMLAQKIALETNERAALKVANRFETAPVYGASPGAVALSGAREMRERYSYAAGPGEGAGSSSASLDARLVAIAGSIWGSGRATT